MTLAQETLKGKRLNDGSFATFSTAQITFGATVTKNDTVTINDDTYEFFDDVAVAAGNIEVVVTGDLTAPVASDALIVAINANTNSAVRAVDISTSLVRLFRNTKGAGDVTLSETFTSGSNVVDGNVRGGTADSLYAGQTFRYDPSAADVTNGSIFFAFEFDPLVVRAALFDGSGDVVAWDGVVTIDHTNFTVELDNSVDTDFEATHTFVVEVA